VITATKTGAHKLVTIDEMKDQAESYARTAFAHGQTFPHGITWDTKGGVMLHALDLHIAQAIQTIGMHGCYAAALMTEAWGAKKEDIIAITLDHPEVGVVLGRIEVDEGKEPRLRPGIRWTTEVKPGNADNPTEFPSLTTSGKIVTLRVRPA
jgi:hypothetical protein